MSELSVDRTTEALTKAQAEVQRAQIAHDIAKDDATHAQTSVFRAQAVEEEARAQRESVTRDRDSIVAEMRVTDHDDLATLQRLGIERSTLDTQLVALDGAAERAQSEHAKARTNLDLARAKLAHATAAHDAANEKHEQAQEAHREAELVAAGDPFALARKEKQDHAEAVLKERLREVAALSTFSPGGGPCEVAIDAEKARTREPREASPALAPGDHGWGSSSFERGRYSSPAGGPRRDASEHMQEGAKPYNTNDPLSNE